MIILFELAFAGRGRGFNCATNYKGGKWGWGLKIGQISGLNLWMTLAIFRSKFCIFEFSSERGQTNVTHFGV